jgi:hypothetical protein
MSVSAAEIDAVALRVDEQVVGITTRFDSCNGAAIPHGKDAKLSWTPKGHENSSGIFVQSHWKIAVVADRPTRYLFASGTVDHRDLVRLRDVNEDASQRPSELKTFGMSPQLHVCDLAVSRCVDHC